MTELHVIPDEYTAAWRVCRSDTAAPLSQHTNATEAELAAQAWAERFAAERIVVYDCYHRTRELAPSITAMRARTQVARPRKRTGVSAGVHHTADEARAPQR